MDEAKVWYEQIGSYKIEMTPSRTFFAPNHIAFSFHLVPFEAHNSDYIESSLHFAFPNRFRQLCIVAMS